MACTVANMNVTLPHLLSLFPASSLPSPSPSPTTHDDLPDTSAITRGQHKELYPTPRLPFPLSFPSHVRGVSTNSLDSDASAPSLVCSPSPSPSPSPTRSYSPAPFLLIPCELGVADAVVVVSLPNVSRSTPAASSRPLVTPIFRPCKPSQAGAMLLIGPAISAHARKRAAAGQRRMHPYRIVHDRRANFDGTHPFHS